MAACCNTTGRFRAGSPSRHWAAVQQRHGYPTFRFYSQKNVKVNHSLSGAPWVNTRTLFFGIDRYYGPIFASKGSSTFILGIWRLL